MEEENKEKQFIEQQFIESLTMDEKTALKIAQEMLNIKDVKEMNGFKEFMKKKCSSKI